VADYAPPYGRSRTVTYTAGAAITGGQLLIFTAADTVSPSTLGAAPVAGVAGHDAASGSPVTVHMGAGVVHESAAAAALPAPAAPAPTTATTGGTVLAGAYNAEVTYVDASGESLPSPAGAVTTTGTTSTVTVPSPPVQAGATGWYAYVTQAGGAANTATRQQTAGSPTAIGTGLTITAPPTSGGAALPSSNSSGITPGEMLTAGAAGTVAGGAAAGADIGVAVRAGPDGNGNVRWKSTRG
jgi:hypothetical protein